LDPLGGEPSDHGSIKTKFEKWVSCLLVQQLYKYEFLVIISSMLKLI
jgi:hypothetical protein